MTTTVQATLDQAYRYLQAGQNEQRNRLNGDVGINATTVRMSYPLGGIQAGATIAIDLELFHVWEADEANRVVVVSGGQYGSSAAAHGDGAHIYVAPKFSYFAMFSELNNELASYTSPTNGLYQIKAVDLTVSSSTIGYDLGDASCLEIIDVRQEQYGTQKDWPRLNNFELIIRGESSDFPSGFELAVPDFGIVPGKRMRVRYKAAFTPVTGLSDTLEGTAGMPATAIDIPPIGIAAQLMAVRENKRTFTEAQADTRRANEVPPGATTAAARQLALMRMTRLREEAARLDRYFPVYRR